jgi:hypothetical protein
MVTVMTQSRLNSAGEHIIEPMLALAGCSKQQQIIVTGSKGIEIALELKGRGYVQVMSSANCGQTVGQYDVALVDWRQRSLRALETTFDWLLDFLSPAGVLVVWVDSQKSVGNQELLTVVERRGFSIEATTIRPHGCALAARRRQLPPLSKAA